MHDELGEHAQTSWGVLGELGAPRAGEHARIGQKAIFSLGELSKVGVHSEWVSLQRMGKVRYYKNSILV